MEFLEMPLIKKGQGVRLAAAIGENSLISSSFKSQLGVLVSKKLSQS
jgi:hypothetical protein